MIRRVDGCAKRSRALAFASSTDPLDHDVDDGMHLGIVSGDTIDIAHVPYQVFLAVVNTAAQTFRCSRWIDP
jgi:hypothetical protein